MKNVLIIIATLSILSSSCDTVQSKTKTTINKSGELVGKTATEFIEGISEGVESALACDIQLTKELTEAGITTGKSSVQNHADGGKNNQLTLYMIFEKDTKKKLSAMAYDKNDLEIGRATAAVNAKAGEAAYVDFIFDPRTYLEVKTKVVIR